MSDLRLIPETADIVWFTGPDSVRFLNDLISQEVGSLAPGRVVRSLLLSPRGKLDHLLWALRDEEGIGLVTASGRGDDLAAKLGRYRIRVKVEISPPESLFLVLGDVGLEPGYWERRDSGLVAGLPWGGPPLNLVGGDTPGYGSLTPAEWESLRIEELEPRFGVDVDESTIPQESGLVAESVDFFKGCYLGQELVARIDSRGHVNKHLRLLEFAGEPPSPGAVVFEGEREVGAITSVAGDIGLAMVRREVPLGASVSAGGSEAIVRR
jgi:folate-binding protein YgfZ